MRLKDDHQDWLKEFQSFMKEQPIATPRFIDDIILSNVKKDLNPSLGAVLAKLFGLHALGAAIVSLFCPQLGVGPVIGEVGIMSLFMQFGPLACAALCGAIFLGVSTALATIFLSREEFRLANQYRFLNISLLASISFAGLMLAGGRADQLSYAFWIVGAMGMGWTILRLGASIRLRPRVA